MSAYSLNLSTDSEHVRVLICPLLNVVPVPQPAAVEVVEVLPQHPVSPV